ncbi:unnamed protein product, partial [Dovyalis caffra]
KLGCKILFTNGGRFGCRMVREVWIARLTCFVARGLEESLQGVCPFIGGILWVARACSKA